MADPASIYSKTSTEKLEEYKKRIGQKGSMAFLRRPLEAELGRRDTPEKKPIQTFGYRGKKGKVTTLATRMALGGTVKEKRLLGA